MMAKSYYNVLCFFNNNSKEYKDLFLLTTLTHKTDITTYTIEGACGNSDTTMISVIDCTIPDPHVYIPNVFSPNGDGENDVLYVRGEGITGLEFIVFNRWGEKIFESVDVNHGWDGTYKGKKCMPGVYTYMANVTFSNLQQVVQAGTITLVR